MPLRSGILLALWAVAGCAPAGPPPPVPLAPPSSFAAGAVPPGVRLAPTEKAKVLAALPAVEQFFAAQLEKQKLPGLAIGVVIEDELVYSRAFGVRDMTSKAAVDVDTVFRIASLTKSFTAMAILKLRDEGRLSLEDPADKYLPELAALAYPTRDSARVTIRQLLTHSAGFPEDNPWADRPLDVSEAAFAALLAKGVSFSSPPNTAFEYSNLGYTILGVIVSRASGVPYRTYVTNQILRPLGMTATVFDEREVPSSRLALGYRRDGDTLVSEANTRDGAYAAMGGLYSSVRDLSRYAAFHLAAWPPRDDPETGPLRRSSVRELHQLARPSRFVVGMEGGAAWGETGGYGLGFFSYETCLFDHLVYHRGGLPGYGSALFMLPKRGVAIITLANATYANPGAGVAMKILQTAGDLKTPAPMAGPALVSARGEVDALLGRWDGSRATNAFDPSFFLGEPADKLKARLAALRSVHGACREAGAIEAENALRGTWRAQCDRGWVDIKVTLAPMLPSKIQFLEIVGSLPPEGPLLAAAGRAAALTEQWDDTVAAQLFAPSLDLDLMKQRLGEVSAARGACKLGDAQRGDGKTQAVFALSCARRPATLEVTFDAPTGKLTDARISALDGPDAKCAQ